MTLEIGTGHQRSPFVTPENGKKLLAQFPVIHALPLELLPIAAERRRAQHLTKRFEHLFLACFFVVDVVLILLALRLAGAMYMHVRLGIEPRPKPVVVDLDLYPIVAVVWAVILQFLPVFDFDHPTSLFRQCATLFKGAVVCVLAMVTIFYLFSIPPPRLYFMYFWVFDLALLMGFYSLLRVAQRWARARGRNIRNVLVVGAGSNAQAVIAAITSRAWSGLRVVGVVGPDAEGGVHGVPMVGGLDRLPSLLRAGLIDEVIIALPSNSHDTVLQLSHDLQRFPVRVNVVPDVADLLLVTSTVASLWGVPLLSVRQTAITGPRWLLKRALDIAVSGVLLVCVAPILAIIALAVLLESGSRSTEIDKGQEPQIKRPGDPRVTPFGAHMRRLSLDELPQLINVLRGDMSLVGPRPELPSIVERYAPWQHARHVVPPGMTGWWQVNGRSEAPMHLNTQLDLYYIQNYSMLLDLQIMARTIAVIVRGRGAF
jgi:lipopolysaccharide/colanic/teichoic acid biosynthesis glycosyltransferase